MSNDSFKNQSAYDLLNQAKSGQSAGTLLAFARSCLQGAAAQYYTYGAKEKCSAVEDILSEIELLRAKNKAEYEARAQG